MNHTFGYVLCCQSPALFLLAIALVIRFFVRRGKAKFRAVLSLVAGLVCVALGVVLYYQGMLREYFAVRNFWHIRTPGWIGLALVALLLLYLGIQSCLRASARRAEEKEAIRAENQRQLAMEQARADAYEAGRADVMSSFVSAAYCRVFCMALSYGFRRLRSINRAGKSVNRRLRFRIFGQISTFAWIF